MRAAQRWCPGQAARRASRYCVAGLLLRGLTSAQSFSELDVRSWSGGLRLYGEYRDETRGTGTGSLEEQARILREELFLQVAGSYYHPKFLTYDLQGVLGLEQRDEDVSGSTGATDIDREQDGWDARLRFFETHPYSADVYSYRKETTSRQTFLGTTDALVQENGVSLNAARWWLPSRLHAHHFEYEGQGFDTFRERRDNVLLEGQRSTNSSDVRYALETNDVDIDSTGQSYTDHGASLGAGLFFGEGRRDRWTNDLRWRDQDGAIATSNLSFASALHESWTEDLDSDHRVLLTRSETGAASSDTLDLFSEVQHQLFDSLTSALSGSLGRSTIGDGTVHDEGAGVRFAYRKRVPFGELRLDSAFDGTLRDQAGIEDPVPVLDEAHVMSAGTPAFLDNTAVDTATILVTDLGGATLYVLGLDYQVTLEGVRTRLDLVPGSAILPGQTVLVDYTFAPAPDLRFKDVAQRFGVGLRFGEYADLALGYDSVRQDRLSGIDNGVLQDSTRWRGSLRTYPLGADAGAELAAEYEDYAADFAPYVRSSFTGNYRLDASHSSTWLLSAGTFRTRFPDDDEREHGTNVSATLHNSLGANSGFDLRGEWHTSRFRSDAGGGYLLDARWTTRIELLEFALAARFSDEEFEVASDQRVASLVLSLTRRF